MCPLNMYRKNKNKNKFDCKRKKKLFYLNFFSIPTLKKQRYWLSMSTISFELTVKAPHRGCFLYSRHLSPTDFFLRNGWNGTQTLKMKPLCSRYFMANRSIWWTSNHITPYNWHRHILYEAFLARNVYTFYFWQCLTTLLKFSLIFILLFS